MERVSPQVYDHEYFLSNTCEGADEFHNGRGLSPLKARQVARLHPGPGTRVLDLGCGRGEVLLACAQRGARVAGLDYAAAAVQISLDTLADADGDAEIVHGDVTQLPWPDASFDAVLSGDVIEHLVPADAVAMLGEAHRVLKPGGRLIVHTSPNRLFLLITWPFARRALRLTGHGDTVTALDAWIEASKSYHVNEQSVYSLRRALRQAGFATPTVWIDPNIVRDGSHHTTEGLRGTWMIRTGQRLAGVRPIRLLAGNDVWAVATK